MIIFLMSINFLKNQIKQKQQSNSERVVSQKGKVN